MNWQIIMILAMACGVPATAYAQTNQSILELAEQGIVESGKSIRHAEKMTDIFNSCTERVLERDVNIVPPCVEIAKAYNQAMTNLFSQHRDIVETILYG